MIGNIIPRWAKAEELMLSRKEAITLFTQRADGKCLDFIYNNIDCETFVLYRLVVVTDFDNVLVLDIRRVEKNES